MNYSYPATTKVLTSAAKIINQKGLCEWIECDNCPMNHPTISCDDIIEADGSEVPPTAARISFCQSYLALHGGLL